MSECNEKLRLLRVNSVIERIKNGTFGPTHSDVYDKNYRYRNKFELSVKNKLVEVGVPFVYEKNYEQLIKIDDEKFFPSFCFSINDFLNESGIEKLENQGFLVDKSKKILIKDCIEERSEWTYYDIKKYIEGNYIVFVVTDIDNYFYYVDLFEEFGSNVQVFTLNKVDFSKYIRELTITSENIDYAHILPWHHGKCSRLHGHTGKLKISLRGYIGNKTPWIVDFGELKPVIKTICSTFDHKMIIGKTDILTSKFDEDNNMFEIQLKNNSLKLNISGHSLNLIEDSPTAENISMILAEKIGNAVKNKDIESVIVEFSEGVNNHSTAVYENNIFEKRYIDNKFKDLMLFRLLLPTMETNTSSLPGYPEGSNKIPFPHLNEPKK